MLTLGLPPITSPSIVTFLKDVCVHISMPFVNYNIPKVSYMVMGINPDNASHGYWHERILHNSSRETSEIHSSPW